MILIRNLTLSRFDVCQLRPYAPLGAIRTDDETEQVRVAGKLIKFSCTQSTLRKLTARKRKRTLLFTIIVWVFDVYCIRTLKLVK